MRKLLINERPVLLLPSLAMKIGLYEAAVLQQIHFWLTSSTHFIEGRRWIYNTYKEWHNQFPFWSESTIKRAILALEDQGLLISGNWNFSKMDKTKWYTIDYEKLADLKLNLIQQSPDQTEPSTALPEPSTALPEPSTALPVISTAPAEPSIMAECSVEETDQTKAIPKSTSENTSKKEILIVEIIHYLNDKTNSSYRATTHKTKNMIQARINEGFTLADFKKVIDLKSAEWLDNPHWSKYLRPETLFGTKFESYLNQKPTKKKITEEDFNLDD